VPAIAPGPDLEHGLYVFNAVQVQQSTANHIENRRVGSPGSASGKGMTADQARVSCLAEAVERYSCGWVQSAPRKLGRIADFGDTAWHPDNLLLFSDAQYDNRATLNKPAGPLHFIPRRFDETAEIEWSPVWSLTNECERWLPTRRCYFDYQAINVPGDHAFCYADSNGCASGATMSEAILQGMLELVERDAVALWWYNRIQRRGISLEGINDAFVRADWPSTPRDCRR
jgi:thiazole/oxazole-forming peptide maturase SagD family component